jgi:hypothetical protein
MLWKIRLSVCHERVPKHDIEHDIIHEIDLFSKTRWQRTPVWFHTLTVVQDQCLSQWRNNLDWGHWTRKVLKSLRPRILPLPKLGSGSTIISPTVTLLRRKLQRKILCRTLFDLINKFIIHNLVFFRLKLGAPLTSGPTPGVMVVTPLVRLPNLMLKQSIRVTLYNI